MGKLQKNQSGFSVAEVLLLLVIVGIVGFMGWFVWQAKQNTDRSLTSNNSTEPTYKNQNNNTGKTPSTTEVFTTPVVAYVPDGLFSSAEKSDLMAKIVGPLWDYYKDEVASIEVEVYSPSKFNTGNTDDKYIVTAIRKNGGTEALLYGSKSKGIDYWLPSCESHCEFSTEFKSKYPELIKKYESQ